MSEYVFMFEVARRAINFWRRRGTKHLIVRIIKEFVRNDVAVEERQIQGVKVVVNVRDYLDGFYQIARPMVTLRRNKTGLERVNIVTDSVRAGSLFGGVGTALLFGVYLSNRLGTQCRVVTRTERPDERGVFDFLKLYGVCPEKELQFKFEPCDDGGGGVDLSEGDLFVTTSWWTTASTLPGVDPKNVIYLLQEDERMFYPVGDDWVRANEVMGNEDIRIIINTKLLFDHLVSNGFGNIMRNGSWFEPSFPEKIYGLAEREEGNRVRKLFFYARPDNPRNLFRFGLEVIDLAIMKGIIKPEEWEILFVGKNIPDVELYGGVSPKIYEKLPWVEYSSLLSDVDVGLSLMCTPHPSYPPLDLAASGAVVVTNKYGIKRDLSNYSKNIICSDLDKDAMVSALELAVRLSGDDMLRTRNYMESNLGRSWERSFEELINEIAGSDHD